MPRAINTYDEDDDRLAQALNEIYENYGVTASVTQKRKSLRKFGSRAVVGTTTEVVATTVGTNLSYPNASTNACTVVSSSSGSDTQNINLYEGHTIASGALTFASVSTPFALTGQTNKTLPTALRDVTRARLASPAAGTIYFHTGGATTSGVPNDLTTVHAVIPAGEIQTQKCQTAISANDYWIITGATGSVLSKTSAWAQFRIEIKPVADTHFYPLTQWIGVSDSSGTIPMIGPQDPYLIVPANYDARIVCQANTASVSVSAGAQGYLARAI